MTVKPTFCSSAEINAQMTVAQNTSSRIIQPNSLKVEGNELLTKTIFLCRKTMNYVTM